MPAPPDPEEPEDPLWLEPQAAKKTTAREQGALLILMPFILAPYYNPAASCPDGASGS
jgi:hypothetical protein